MMAAQVEQSGGECRQSSWVMMVMVIVLVKLNCFPPPLWRAAAKHGVHISAMRPLATGSA